MIKARINLLIAIATIVCTAASCGPKLVCTGQTRCAFADPDFMTQWALCTVVAQYFIDKHDWPTEKSQLIQEWKEMVIAEEKQPPPETEVSEFVDQFTILDLEKAGNNLVLHYSFKGKEKTIEQKITLRPGASSDQIIQEASN